VNATSAATAKAPQHLEEPAVKVVYIAGWGRSGTTILDNILGHVDGFFSAGELAFFWSRGMLGGFRCGCGELIRECVVWRDVLASPLGESTIGDHDPGRVVEWQRSTTRARHTWNVLRNYSNPSGTNGALGNYARMLSAVYRAIASTTGARVVVDSSKNPAGAAMLGIVPGIEPYVVQMVRDPRAVAYSWARAKHQPGFGDDRNMITQSSLNSTLHWVIWNAAAASVRRAVPQSLLIRYEDFIAAPKRTVEEIISLVGESPASIPFEDEHRVRLSSNHTVSGNPSRFKTGVVPIRSDDEWVRRQPARARVITTSIALPFMNRYGYEPRVSRIEGDGHASPDLP
jgi:hypothetical protein